MQKHPLPDLFNGNRIYMGGRYQSFAKLLADLAVRLQKVMAPNRIFFVGRQFSEPPYHVLADMRVIVTRLARILSFDKNCPVKGILAATVVFTITATPNYLTASDRAAPFNT